MEYLAKLQQLENAQVSLLGKRIVIAFVLLLSLLATSCSNQALFESIQIDHRQRCETIPISQQAACVAQYQTSYEEYRREREALLREDSFR